ncbi:hypothetical protein [Streptomyces mirabilis]
MNLTFDNEWRATVTDDPLRITPRFTSDSVDVGRYADAKERERFLADTFGSQEWLWDNPDVLRFEPADRKLVRPGGLRADEVRDFRLEMCAVLCRTPGNAVLTGLRDLDVLDKPLEARVGIAPDVALLVQHGTVVGWSLTDPARYLTTGFAAPMPTRRPTPPDGCLPSVWIWSPSR